MNKNIIPIAFSTDENYAMPLAVTITSLLKNADNKTKYDIYILIDKEFSAKHKELLFSLEKNYKNCKLTFLSLENAFDDVKINENLHFTKPAFYRLMLPTVLPELSKIIYLDCDIIVQKDLTELYNMNIDNFYIAGVDAALTIELSGQKYANDLGIPTINQYINSGVMLMNLLNLRKDNLVEKFIKLSKLRVYNLVDNDIICIACYDNIKRIHLKYNLLNKEFLNQQSFRNISAIRCTNYFLKHFGKEQISEAIDDNYIIHYASSVKPWKSKECSFSDVWWEYFKLSPYNQELEMIIPVAFATDENYAMPLSVAMTSLLENANETTHYEIYVLIDKEFSTETKDKILQLQDRYSNCKIEFISLEHKLGDVKIKTHVTKVGRYRLLLGSLLPNIDKCIYLDCDIIVQQDLTDMYNIDIEDFYIAGVIDPFVVKALGKNHADEIKLKNVDNYVNSGVLLMNLDNIRKNNVETKFKELTKRTFKRFVDQDIVNIGCFGKIKNIDLKYNLFPAHFPSSTSYNNFDDVKPHSMLLMCYSKTTIINSLKNNVILHFADKIKPWNNSSISFYEIWKKYYDISPFNPNLITRQSNDNLNVVFICEENSIKALSVTIVSLLENLKNSKYQINILSKNKFSNENQKLLYKFEENYDCHITFNICDNINKSNNKEIAKSIANFYENIDRCIYLDYNTVVQKDLSELLNLELGNNSIAGVKQTDDEINSSVLLIDCDKIRENTIEIGEIDLKFNLQAYLLKGEKTFNFGKQVEIKGDLVEKFDKKQLKSALRENVIFSYTEDVNPFRCDSCSFSYIWWKYFRLSPLSKLKRISPKVSVILPVYNVGKYLRECLDSLINQTLEDIEIILVNDGSTDDSIEILSEYAEFDKRITILNQENQGAATARNNGLAIAKGQYLSILDSDDFFDLTLLEKAYNNAVENDSDIVVYNYMGFNNNSEQFNKVNHSFPKINGAFSYKDIPDQIFNTLSHNAWSKMFRTKFIKNIDLKFQCVYRTDDVYFTNMALLQAKKITTINNHLVYYRTGISSQSTSAREPLSFVDAWKEVFSKIKSLGLYNEVEKSFVNSMLQSSLYHLSIMKNTDGYELVYNYISNQLDKDFELSKCENEIINSQLNDSHNYIKKTSFKDYILKQKN